jgi:hypothetical protein
MMFFSIKMPLTCTFLSHEDVATMNHQILRLPMSHPLRKECVDGEVKLMRYEDIYYTHSAGGFYFERSREAFINGARTYHCSAFVIDDPGAVSKLLDRFREQHGAKMFARMDYAIVVHRDQRLMLVKFPPCMLRHMLAPSGGQMKTGLIGPRDALGELPALVKTGALANAQEYMDGRYGVVVATGYSEGYLSLVERLHWDIVREVIAHPGRGLTVCPVGAWEP